MDLTKQLQSFSYTKWPELIGCAGVLVTDSVTRMCRFFLRILATLQNLESHVHKLSSLRYPTTAEHLG